MRTLPIALLMLPLCALGCRTDPNRVLLEQESREWEGEAYRLQAMLDDACAARESTIRENEALKRELAGGDRGAGPAPRSTPSVESPSSRPRGKDPRLEAPTIELPEPSGSPSIELPESGGAPSIEMPNVPSTPGLGPKDEEAAFSHEPAAAITLNSRLTGGLDRDGHGGDEGIMVAFEARDAQGRLVKSPGSVSIVVMDPSLDGSASRIARWDYEAGEVPSHYHSTFIAKGLQFELPWPATPPINRDLRVFIRVTSADGTKLRADAPIIVRLASDPPRVQRHAEVKTEPPASTRASREPKSRVKNAKTRSEEAGDVSNKEERDDSRRDRRAQREEDESMREARAGRPVWKPYR